jgi:hypothetical protein
MLKLFVLDAPDVYYGRYILWGMLLRGLEHL